MNGMRAYQPPMGGQPGGWKSMPNANAAHQQWAGHQAAQRNAGRSTGSSPYDSLGPVARAIYVLMLFVAGVVIGMVGVALLASA